MSKIKDTIKDEVVDSYKEHSQHDYRVLGCSECWKRMEGLQQLSSGWIYEQQDYQV